MKHREILKLVKLHLLNDIANIVDDFMADFQCHGCHVNFHNEMVMVEIEYDENEIKDDDGKFAARTLISGADFFYFCTGCAVPNTLLTISELMVRRSRTPTEIREGPNKTFREKRKLNRKENTYIIRKKIGGLFSIVEDYNKDFKCNNCDNCMWQNLKVVYDYNIENKLCVEERLVDNYFFYCTDCHQPHKHIKHS